MKEIKGLLDKYFEGLTSTAEEKILREYFRRDDLPEELRVYQPLFAWFDEETALLNDEVAVIQPKRKKLWLTLYLPAVAASLLLLLGIGSLLKQEVPCICEGSYVMIDGKCYTDPSVIRVMASEAWGQVASGPEDFFDEEEEYNGGSIVKEQLREFGDLFNEE